MGEVSFQEWLHALKLIITRATFLSALLGADVILTDWALRAYAWAEQSRTSGNKY